MKILPFTRATSALDAASETLVNEAVRNITSSHSLTTILIAHRLSTLKTADEIAFMQNGQVVERGTYEELAREGTEFWNSVRSQMLGTTISPAVNTVQEEKWAQKPAA
jgi:ABC-type multidrug transport system fused ATPase/permease subunit